MPYCYSCNIDINQTNWSIEHIINRCIGGHISSKDLLCKTCNEKFGSSIDTAINDHLRPYAFILNIKLQGEQFKGGLKLKSMSGNEIVVAPGMIPFDKIQEKEGDMAKWELAIHPDHFEKMMERKKKELSKKGKVNGRTYNVPPPTERYYIMHKGARSPDEIIFDGQDFHRAIAKMCLNFYLYQNLPRKFCETVRSFVLGYTKDQITSYYYPTNTVVHSLENEEVSHILHLRGDRKQQTLYGYIELFNMVKIIVPFSFDYTGNDLTCTYCWDVLNAVVLDKKIKLPLARHHLEALPLIPEQMLRGLGPAHERLLKIATLRTLIW